MFFPLVQIFSYEFLSERNSLKVTPDALSLFVG